MIKPYGLVGTLGLVPTQPTQQQLWFRPSCCPCSTWIVQSHFHYQQHFGPGKRTWEPLLQRGEGLAHPRNGSYASLHAVCLVPWGSGSSCLLMGTADGQGCGSTNEDALVFKSKPSPVQQPLWQGSSPLLASFPIRTKWEWKWIGFTLAFQMSF